MWVHYTSNEFAAPRGPTPKHVPRLNDQTLAKKAVRLINMINESHKETYAYLVVKNPLRKENERIERNKIAPAELKFALNN